MDPRLPPNGRPPNAHDPGNLADLGPRRTWVGIAALVLAILSAVATGLAMGLVAFRDLTAAGCAPQLSQVDAAGLSAGIGAILGGVATVIGWVGLTGPRRIHGVTRVSAIVGLALGCLSLLVAAGIFLLTTAPCLPSPI